MNSKEFSNGARFSTRLWISTSDNWNAEAERAIRNQNPLVLRIGSQDLRLAAVDWAKIDMGTVGEEALKNFREPLEHQRKAIAAVEEYFRTHERGKLIMSCGTGKTYISLKIAEKIFPHGKILFLVPSIALLSQTLSEWSTYAAKTNSVNKNSLYDSFVTSAGWLTVCARVSSANSAKFTCSTCAATSERTGRR